MFPDTNNKVATSYSLTLTFSSETSLTVLGVCFLLDLAAVSMVSQENALRNCTYLPGCKSLNFSKYDRMRMVPFEAD